MSTSELRTELVRRMTECNGQADGTVGHLEDCEKNDLDGNRHATARC